MELYILTYNDETKKYERVSYIDQSESVLWNVKYNDVGECEIYITCDIELINYLQEGNYIYRNDDEMFCKITSVEIETDVENGDYLIVTGTDMVKILGDRIVRWEIVFNGLVFEFIKKLINDNIINPPQEQRQISNFVFDLENANDFTETITITSFTDDLLSTITTICKTYNYGFKLSFDLDQQIFKFKLYKGIDKTSSQNDEYVEFSPSYGNIISSKYKVDSSNYKNLCYVGYKNTNDEFALLSVFNTQTEPFGEERKEIYVDGSNISREITLDDLKVLFPNVSLNGTSYYNNDLVVANVAEDKIVVTDDTYFLLIRILGLNTLSERNKTQEFNGEVDTSNSYIYKEDYNVGDIVKVINDYGIQARAQIIEVMESDDNEDGYIVTPKFEYID